jgi:hypothetical protein
MVILFYFLIFFNTISVHLVWMLIVNFYFILEH